MTLNALKVVAMSKELEPGRLYSIGEVSSITGVKDYVLRQWDNYFHVLKPRRRPAGKVRMYSERDIKIIWRIKIMLFHEHMTYKGAREKLAQELGEMETPTDLFGMIDIADKIADKARAIIHLLDPDGYNKLIKEEDDGIEE